MNPWVDGTISHGATAFPWAGFCGIVAGLLAPALAAWIWRAVR